MKSSGLLDLAEKILLIGNDWLAHVILGVSFAQYFGWYGIILSFLSHPFVDMIPHGHREDKWGYFWETWKGLLIALAIIIQTWIVFNFVTSIMYGLSMFFSLNYDFVLVLAKKIDKKEYWKRFVGRKEEVVFKFARFIICFNMQCHWFGETKVFKKWHKEIEIFNTLPGHKHYAFGITYWNLLQLLPIVLLGFCHFIFI